MPLQNRVLPDGEIVAIPERGTFTGNRGIIHDPATRTLLKRRWTTHAWIVCVCEFRGRRRAVMAQRSWTELFFLDEATALAAGHRPCFFCRREDAKRFQAAWAEGNGVALPKVAVMDGVLHGERLEGEGRGKHKRKSKRLHVLPAAIAALPDGVMVRDGDVDYAVVGGRPWVWSPRGYRRSETELSRPFMLTPPSTVRAMVAGYRPVLHSSLTSG
ncbi:MULTISPECIES: hypothetical protein [unclassified Beijerinckia]|uniref:hypothetical protein n=1 Tax=unclassified Beijerinckia TaxID=2638183 RepID=UPI00089C6BE4|nr:MULTISPECIES: hypothetical protein [unclassified Beijerinckia]MDH7795285.1 hypothetical protein [Beijerinckia sp. GAS462]SEB95208.1 hypothetical protein SAMN05443249_1558 [Beijerinckia sp. 28-YEA-48]